MKKIIDSIHIFSKFSFSFILLCSLIFTLYILFISYQKEAENNFDQISFEQDIKNNIVNNSNQIKTISKEIEKTNLLLNKLNNKFNLDFEKNKDLKTINNNIKILNQELTNLSNEFKKIEKQSINFNNQANQIESNTVDKSINDIIDLILIKFQDNLSFDKEFSFLEKKIKPQDINIFEKINLLKEDKYKGHYFLETKFESELNIFLKSIINNNSNFFIKKIILPYVTISPSNINKINNETIIKLNNIKSYIEKRDIKKALNGITKIDKYDSYFKHSINEMKKYLNFKTEILKLKL